MRRRLLLLCALGMALLSRAFAAVQDPAHEELAGLVAAAERICEVQVLEAAAQRRADGLIETCYLLATTTPLKGEVAALQEVRMPGGEVAGRGLMVPGLPQLRRGERVLLFLSQEVPGRGWRLPVGLEEGVVRMPPGRSDRSARLQAVDAEVRRQER